MSTVCSGAHVEQEIFLPQGLKDPMGDKLNGLLFLGRMFLFMKAPNFLHTLSKS